MRPINVILKRSSRGMWSWCFDHAIHRAFVGGFFSDFAAKAHARECANALGRGVQFVVE